jgi:cytochrome c-type biogenesis protein CcmH
VADTSSRSLLQRWVPLLAVVALVAALVIGARPGAERTPAQRSASIASNVKCPTCQGLSVAQSSTGISATIRQEIDRQIALGRSDDEVVAFLRDRFGDEIIINPPARGVGALVWAAPIAFLIMAFGGMIVAMRRWRTRTSESDMHADDVDAVSRARQAVQG